MDIVIVGAGGLGGYVASILSGEQHNVVIIDKDPRKLEKVAMNIDVATREGSGTDWQLMDDLLDLSPDFLLALTDNDETNLVSCSIARHLGYPRTIARIRDSRFLNRTRLDFSQMFEVDSFISPELLVANDILKYMVSPGSLAIENFSHGTVQLRTLTVPPNWRHSDIPLKDLELPEGVMVGLIHRKIAEKTEEKGRWNIIFPHGDSIIKSLDEVSFIGKTDSMPSVNQFLGVHHKGIQSVVIIGGSLTGVNLAKLLEKRKISVRLIEKKYEKCIKLAKELPNSTIINHDGTDLNFFRAEKIGTSDVFIACTGSDEVNLLSTILGKEVGCQENVITLSNTSYVPIATQMGINHVASARIVAADQILSQIRSEKVNSLFTLYENQAEVVEINVSMDSRVSGVPISELGPLFPKDFLIAIIQNRGRVMVAHGKRIISPNDTVIVLTSPKHLSELETLF